MNKLWRSGVLVSAAGFVVGIGNYGFQCLIGRLLERAEYGYVNSTLQFAGLLGLPVLIASTSLTHYVAHYQAQGDDARLRGLILGCRKFLFRLTLVGSVAAALLIRPLSVFFHCPRQSLMGIALLVLLTGLWVAYANALCLGMGWFKRLALISLAGVALRLSFGGLALLKYPVAEVGVLATGVALLSNLALLRWRKELVQTGESISPWNRELAGYFMVGAACIGGGYFFGQGDLLIAQRNFSGTELGTYSAPAQLARALPMLVGPMLQVLFTSRSGYRTGAALPEQLKLLGLYAAGLAAGAVGLLLFRALGVWLIFGKFTPAAAAMIAPLAAAMISVGLVQALGMWALASRWFGVAVLYGVAGLAYWLTLLHWGKTLDQLLKLMPVAAGAAFGLVLVAWLIAMRRGKSGQASKAA
jgi:O-antigen/teichoic acid export membrane protein